MRSKLAAALLAFTALANVAAAQTAEQLESQPVNRVAAKMNCSCGCKLNMACRMDPYPCRMCWENKKKILSMQQAGMSDTAILDDFAQREGKAVLVNPPGILGSLTFYTAGALGLILVLFVIRKYKGKAAPASVAVEPVEDAEYGRYREQIEKEAAKLD